MTSRQNDCSVLLFCHDVIASVCVQAAGPCNAEHEQENQKPKSSSRARDLIQSQFWAGKVIYVALSSKSSSPCLSDFCFFVFKTHFATPFSPQELFLLFSKALLSLMAFPSLFNLYTSMHLFKLLSLVQGSSCFLYALPPLFFFFLMLYISCPTTYPCDNWKKEIPPFYAWGAPAGKKWVGWGFAM